LRDVIVAYSWLSVKGYDLQPVTDYLCMIKYQWPERLRDTPHTPLEALKVPATALDDHAVMARFQQLFGTMVVFVLGHELGHLYYRHKDYATISPEMAQQQEREADAFGLAISYQVGGAPVGAALLFKIFTYLEPFPGDPEFRSDRANRTHPLSPHRIEAIADDIRGSALRFAAPGRTQSATAIAGELQQIARILSDEGVQEGLRRIGQSITVQMLQPRRPGDLPRLAGESLRPAGLFSGTFTGKWFDGKGTDLDVEMVLTRNGDGVDGSYVLFSVDGAGRRYTYGSSSITLTGTAPNGVLDYEWRWGSDHFGRGRLHAREGGRLVVGTWGYNSAVEGAGTWQLRRVEP
jgi:hypothetical protein